MGAISNVKINLAGIKDEGYARRLGSKLETILQQVEKEKAEGLLVLAYRTTSSANSSAG
jgi:formiminotetrahydrofolate cyclodeaminase